MSSRYLLKLLAEADGFPITIESRTDAAGEEYWEITCPDWRYMQAGGGNEDPTTLGIGDTLELAARVAIHKLRDEMKAILDSPPPKARE